MAARPSFSELLSALDGPDDGLSWGDIKRMAPHLSRHDLFPTLRKIEEARTIEERPLHAFREWLDRDREASWSGVVSALRAISKNFLAKKLEDKYCSSAKKPAAIPLSLSSPAPSTSRSSTVHDTLPATPHTLDSVETTASASSPSLSSPQRDGASTIARRGSTASEGTSTASGSTSTASSSMASRGCSQAVTEEAVQLQEQFVTVLTHTKICLIKKAMANKDFLLKFKITLTTLPLSKKHQHLKFLSREKRRIMSAADIDEIFEILNPYWNYVDYSFLEYLLKEFGTSELRAEMQQYITQLEVFERKTSIKQFNSALLDKRDIPDHFSEVIVTKAKDPEQCSLYEVRQFRNEVVNQSSLHGYAMYLNKVSCSSVKITLAFPPEAAPEVWESLNRLSAQCIKMLKLPQIILPLAQRSVSARSSTDSGLTDEEEGWIMESALPVPRIITTDSGLTDEEEGWIMESALPVPRIITTDSGLTDEEEGWIMESALPVPRIITTDSGLTDEEEGWIMESALPVPLIITPFARSSTDSGLTEEEEGGLWRINEIELNKLLEQQTISQHSERATHMVAREPSQPDRDESETEGAKDKPETKPDQKEEDEQKEWENM